MRDRRQCALIVLLSVGIAGCITVLSLASQAANGGIMALRAREGRPATSTSEVTFTLSEIQHRVRTSAPADDAARVLSVVEEALLGGLPTNQLDYPRTLSSVPDLSDKFVAQQLPVYDGSCRIESVGGRKPDGYGAWPACVEKLTASSIVYSFGLGVDISFDVELISRFGLTVHGFDPTISLEEIERIRGSPVPSSFVYHGVGLSDVDGTVAFKKSKDSRIQSQTSSRFVDHKDYSQSADYRAPVLRMSTILCMLGHEYVDVIKIDVEGSEFEIMSSDDVSKWPTSQILLEFHDRMSSQGGSLRTGIYKRLADAGFRLVHESGNKEEVVFLRVSNPAR